MKFEELQQEWQAMKSEPRSHDEWRKMMYASPATRMRSVTRKEVLKFIRDIFIFSLIIYLFDGLATWPGRIWALYGAFQFIDEYVGLRYVSFTPQRDTIHQTLVQALKRVKVTALISKLGYLLIWMAAAYYLGTNHIGDLGERWWALLLLPFLAALSWWRGRKWARKIGEIRELLEGFVDDTQMPVGPAV